MTKISGYPEDTSPTIDDFTVGYDAGTLTTKKSKWSSLIALFFNNIPSGATGNASNITAFTNSGSAGGSGWFVSMAGIKVLVLKGAATNAAAWNTINWAAVGFTQIPFVVGNSLVQPVGIPSGWVEFTSLSSPASGSPEITGCSILTRISTSQNAASSINLIAIGV